MRGHLGTELANKAGEVWESTRDDDGLFKFTQTRSRTRPLEESICFKVRSKDYVDSTGRVEEIGIPEIWKTSSEITLTDAPAVPEMIKTRAHGEFPRTELNVQWMFWNLMRNRGFKWNDMIRQLGDMYGLGWSDIVSLYGMVKSSLIKDDVDLLWHYQGPDFNEPEEGS